MPRIGAPGDAAGTAAVSGDGCTGVGLDAVWQAASARQSADANGAMTGLDMVSCAFALFALVPARRTSHGPSNRSARSAMQYDGCSILLLAFDVVWAAFRPGAATNAAAPATAGTRRSGQI